MANAKEPATIRKHIEMKLSEFQKSNPSLHTVCNELDRNIRDLINSLDDHLIKIQTQMPDYDKHDVTHSERVLDYIEKLLGPTGIKGMPFLEAELLLLCCHFHDTGMAVPDWCFSLLRKTEAPDFVWHKSWVEVLSALRTSGSGWSPSKPYNEVKELFMVPGKERDFYEWLADEIWAYEVYRQGLEPWNKNGDLAQWICETREEYLRSTHGKRANIYGKNIGRFLHALSKYNAIQTKLAKYVGAICATHTQPVDAVWKLPGSDAVNPGLSNEDLSFNPEFLAMLLRLGDVLDFSEDRASRTLYAEHNPMNRTSDKHWLAKNLTGLSVEIKPVRGKPKQIRFMGSFEKPEHYYFIHDYLNWVDSELKNYAHFLENMTRDSTQPDRYDLSLPGAVDRSGIDAETFIPDRELKFTLEQRRVIELLMGARLYSDSFTCLRELYQNALDACRCMRAENSAKGIQETLPIEFGLETDEDTGRRFLYCRDRGIGMTKETIKNYLLRVGNSYYRSAAFRRDNALWGNAVQPISEFGIGLLSCYMIGDRIEVLTRRSGEAETLWVCMETAEDYGYFREPSQELKNRLINHGTEVRVFLKDEYANELKNDPPESAETAINTIALTGEFGDEFLSVNSINNLYETKQAFLWYKLQDVICVPEPDFPVSVFCDDAKPYPLMQTQIRFPLETRLDQILPLLLEGNEDIDRDRLQEVISAGAFLPVYYTDPETCSEIRTWLYLPKTPNLPDIDWSDSQDSFDCLNRSAGPSICVDGLAIKENSLFSCLPDGMCWNFKGLGRPTLSISRETASSLPESFYAVKNRLLEGLYKAIHSAISTHYKKHPEANTQQVRSFLLEYLWHSYNNNSWSLSLLQALWSELSLGVFHDHVEVSLPMRALQTGCPGFSLIITELQNKLERRSRIHAVADILPAVLLRAKYISLETDSVSVEMDNTSPVVDWEQNVTSIVYRAEPKTDSWGHWDAKSNLLPFVSPALFQILEGKLLCSEWGKAVSLHSIMLCDALLNDRFWGNSQVKDAALPQLKSNNWATDEAYHIPVVISNDAPLLMVWINAATPSEEAEQAIQLYGIPAYEKGVREGWTLLWYPGSQDEPFYNWILAPGVVDRLEMAKHIPDEVVEAAEAAGHPLRFTDGTLAFPKD